MVNMMTEILADIVVLKPVDEIAARMISLSEGWSDNDRSQVGFIMRGWCEALTAAGWHETADLSFKVQCAWWSDHRMSGQ